MDLSKLHKIADLKSRAKINLFLHVNGRLDNGYHELESLFYFPDIYDDIQVFEACSVQGSQLFISGVYAYKLNSSSVDDNLIMKAYHAMRLGREDIIPELSFLLNKNLPISAGIGGGSGNAAAVIRFMNDYYDLNLVDGELISIAAKLGADVPPSLYEKPCLVSGIGDKLDFSVDMPKLHILLANPNKPVSTPEIFKMGFVNFRNKMNNVQLSFANGSELLSFLHDETCNMLEDNALKICPEIQSLKASISNLDGCLLSRMSGSGASVFGIFKDGESLREAYDVMLSKYPEYYWAVDS